VRGKESNEGQSKTGTTFFNPGLFKVSSLRSAKSVYAQIRGVPYMFQEFGPPGTVAWSRQV